MGILYAKPIHTIRVKGEKVVDFDPVLIDQTPGSKDAKERAAKDFLAQSIANKEVVCVVLIHVFSLSPLRYLLRWEQHTGIL